MERFEKLLQPCRGAVERYVKYRLPNYADAEDVLQEIYLTAYQKLEQLRAESAFKPWLLSIARNACNEYFRRQAKAMEVPLEEVPEGNLAYGRMGLTLSDTVEDAMTRLSEREQQLLYLYYWQQLPQADIARKLEIPLGTVKSRLFAARQKFKEQYPYPPKGEDTMKKLPKYMPKYTIEWSQQPPFSVKWEELMGWFLIPREGEKLTWGMYDQPSGKCNHVYDMKVTGKAMVHGIPGVELTAREAHYSEKPEIIERTFVAQLTDTHCRYLATLRNDNGVRNYITFLDEEAFMPNWGFGENNCGNEVNLSPKGDIRRQGQNVTMAEKDFLLDIVGRYSVTIVGKTFDTVCVMDVSTYNSGVVSEQFLDKNGRTILWRRYNRHNWNGKDWQTLLPDNDRLTVNGETYVHWYDCITDYIL